MLTALLVILAILFIFWLIGGLALHVAAGLFWVVLIVLLVVFLFSLVGGRTYL